MCVEITYSNYLGKSLYHLRGRYINTYEWAQLNRTFDWRFPGRLTFPERLARTWTPLGSGRAGSRASTRAWTRTGHEDRAADRAQRVGARSASLSPERAGLQSVIDGNDVNDGHYKNDSINFNVDSELLLAEIEFKEFKVYGRWPYLRGSDSAYNPTAPGSNPSTTSTLSFFQFKFDM